MKIAVCEDDMVYVTGMRNAIDTWKNEKGITDVSVIVYQSADDLLEAWENGRLFDLLFLDIEFKYMSGFELARRIREVDLDIPIVFVTNLTTFMQKGYEVSAMRYIRKPIAQSEIHACLDACYNRARAMDTECFVIQRKGHVMRLPYANVLYIVAEVHAVTIVTTKGEPITIPIHTSFEEYSSKFPAEFFLRCHKGYIVNMMYVEDFTPTDIMVMGGDRIPVSRKYKKELLKTFQDRFINEVHL